MGNRINRYRCEVALAVGLSVVALNACVAEIGPTESDGDESAASVQQPSIPGASVVQSVGAPHHINANSVAQLFLSCTEGKLVGGGYSWGGAGADVVVYNSSRSGNGWTVVAQNRSLTQGVDVEINVQCLKGTGASFTHVWSADTQMPANGSAVAQVACPPGSILAGGGFVGNNALYAYQNTPKVIDGTNMWVVGGKNLNSQDPVNFKAQAICLSGVGGGATIKSRRVLSVPAGGEVTMNSLACPDNTYLSSGGSLFLSGTANTLKSTLRKKNDASLWTATMVNNESVGNTADVRTVCLELWSQP